MKKPLRVWMLLLATLSVLGTAMPGGQADASTATPTIGCRLNAHVVERHITDLCSLPTPGFEALEFTTQGKVTVTLCGNLTGELPLDLLTAVAVQFSSNCAGGNQFQMPMPSEVLVDLGGDEQPAVAMLWPSAVELPRYGRLRIAWTTGQGPVWLDLEPGATPELLYLLPEFDGEATLAVGSYGTVTLSVWDSAPPATSTPTATLMPLPTSTPAATPTAAPTATPTSAPPPVPDSTAAATVGMNESVQNDVWKLKVIAATNMGVRIVEQSGWQKQTLEVAVPGSHLVRVRVDLERRDRTAIGTTFFQSAVVVRDETGAEYHWQAAGEPGNYVIRGKSVRVVLPQKCFAFVDYIYAIPNGVVITEFVWPDLPPVRLAVR